MTERGEEGKRMTRKRIMDAAVSLFRHKGFERTTVRDIATAVGILSGSLFHHFSSKEDILKEVISEAIEVTLAKMSASVDESDSIEGALKALIVCELETVTGESGAAVGLLISEWRSLSEQGQSAMLELRSAYEGVWLEVLRSASRLGKIRVEPILMRKLIAGALNWTHTWYKDGRSYQQADIAEQLLSMVLTEKAYADYCADTAMSAV